MSCAKERVSLRILCSQRMLALFDLGNLWGIPNFPCFQARKHCSKTLIANFGTLLEVSRACRDGDIVCWWAVEHASSSTEKTEIDRSAWGIHNPASERGRRERKNKTPVRENPHWLGDLPVSTNDPPSRWSSHTSRKKKSRRKKKRWRDPRAWIKYGHEWGSTLSNRVSTLADDDDASPFAASFGKASASRQPREGRAARFSQRFSPLPLSLPWRTLFAASFPPFLDAFFTPFFLSRSITNTFQCLPLIDREECGSMEISWVYYHEGRFMSSRKLRPRK